MEAWKTRDVTAGRKTAEGGEELRQHQHVVEKVAEK